MNKVSEGRAPCQGIPMPKIGVALPVVTFKYDPARPGGVYVHIDDMKAFWKLPKAEQDAVFNAAGAVAGAFAHHGGAAG